MECPKNSVWNPISKRCIKDTTDMGILIKRVIDNKESEKELKDKCDKGEIFNPIKQRCISLDNPIGELIEQVAKNGGKIECPKGTIFNPTTGRCVKTTSEYGKETLGKYSCKHYPEKGEFKARDYQEGLAEYFIKLSEKGILLNHSLGSGKTCSTILMIDTYIKYREKIGKPIKKVYVFTPGSLRENFLFQYCSICGTNPEAISTLMNFVTYNYSLIKNKLPSKSELENSLIIIDEAHNIINGYINQSENYVLIYELLQQIKDTKMILLTGTPISGSLISFYHLIKLIKPSAFESIDAYKNLFSFDKGIYKIKDPDTLYLLLSDVISTYRASQSPEDYPTVKTINETIPMNKNQFEYYKIAVNSEAMAFPPNKKLRITNPAAYKKQRARYYLAITLVKSRQRCNMIYPKLLQNKLDENQPIPPDLMIDQQGWITPDMVKYIHLLSPKTAQLVKNIMNLPGKHMIYSQFKTHYGIIFLQSVLLAHGISCLLFTGDLNDQQRYNINKSFNDPLNNLYGEKYRVLLITEAGAEGQNFLHLRGIHIYEQSTDEFHIHQVIGRGVRYQSHALLKPSERNLTVFRYFALTPGDSIPFSDVPSNRQTSDFVAYNTAISRRASLIPLIDFLATFPVIPQ